ncbi:hypothetical protein [Allocoleopsis sp.]|uniref:hypothetical protein n=1 Tax=Allocoleopsis sp. TaxID=3088169 RepID=UPI002FD15930
MRVDCTTKDETLFPLTPDSYYPIRHHARSPLAPAYSPTGMLALAKRGFSLAAR